MQAEISSTVNTPPGLALLLGRLTGRMQSVWPLLKLASSRACAVLAQFLVQIIVGTTAGPAALGILQLFASWTCIAGEIFAMGLPALALRRISVDFAHGESGNIRTLLRKSRARILQASMAMGILGLLLLMLLHAEGISPGRVVYPWLVVSVLLATPLFALLRLYAESLKATGAALPAVTIENLCTPVALLVVCACYWLNGQAVSVTALVIAFIVSLVIAPFTLLRLLGEQLAGLVQTAPQSRDPCTVPSGDLAYLWACGICSIAFLHLPFLVMPWFIDPSEIGVFAAAFKLINIVTTILLLLGAVYGPAFARSAARQDHAALLVLLRRTQLISIAVFLPAAVMIISLAEPLGRLFGSGFSNLKTYLFILSLGHLVNAATGLSGVLLNMAGAAHREFYILIAAIAFTLCMSLLIGQDYGPTGLALVFSSGIVIKNIGSYLLARSLLNSSGTM